jgi:hypothetical protein
MSSPTLVFIRAHYVNGRLIYRVGDEVPPGLFPQDAINRALDEGWLSECDADVRRSLYQLFPRFSGSSQQEQPLTKENETL